MGGGQEEPRATALATYRQATVVAVFSCDLSLVFLSAGEHPAAMQRPSNGAGRAGSGPGRSRGTAGAVVTVAVALVVALSTLSVR